MTRSRAAPALAALLVLLVALPARAADDCVSIESFGTAKVGEFPPDWRVRKDATKAVYRVAEEGSRRFLHAASHGEGMQAAKGFAWDLGKYPVLAWSWRAVEFPRGANEQTGKNDSALAVYLLVPYSQIRGPKAVKYVFSEAVPVGTRLRSNLGLTQVRVLETGAEKRGRWIEERVNVRDDYLAYFDETDVPKPAGIAILTDSDDTNTSAAGDYADFRVCAR